MNQLVFACLVSSDITSLTCQPLCRTMLQNKERAQVIFTGMGIISPAAGEFLCPVCRRVANCLLPFVPDDSFAHSPPPAQHAAGSAMSQPAESSAQQAGQAAPQLQLSSSAGGTAAVDAAGRVSSGPAEEPWELPALVSHAVDLVMRNAPMHFSATANTGECYCP